VDDGVMCRSTVIDVYCRLELVNESMQLHSSTFH
jgi:hypothetical protein